MAKLTIRIDLSPTSAVGPGKIKLLEQINETGSISAAGRALNMSYRRAWLLVNELNELFSQPVAMTEHGGKAGGGAKLSDFGHSLVRRYRAMEAEAHRALAEHLAAIEGAMRQSRRPPRGRRRSPAP